MFNPSRADVRRFFLRDLGQVPVAGSTGRIGRTAIEIILLASEHHSLLDEAQRNLDRDFSPESGAVIPFCICRCISQCGAVSIDQPRGINTAYRELADRAASEHDALDDLLECLVNVWRAQRDHTAPDEEAFWTAFTAGWDNGAAPSI